MRAGNDTFVVRWVALNVASMVLAYAVYTPLAHGLTGGHGRTLNPSQLLAHSVALSVIALLGFSGQKHVLQPFFRVTGKRVAIGVALFVVVFWAGYYLPVRLGPDMDIILAFAVLGTAMWAGRVSIRLDVRAGILALLAFPVGSFFAQLALVVAIVGFDIALRPSESATHHSIYWLTVGGFGSLFGALIGARPLRTLLRQQPAATVATAGALDA